MSRPTPLAIDAALVEQDMRRWVERAVIGLNLCPFAQGVQAKGLLHYAVSLATEPQELASELAHELQNLHAMDPSMRETTLLVAPRCLSDFLDFNDFLDQAEAIVQTLGLEGEIQIASFHPAYQFGGTTADDITNHTNRAPFPTLHLLRESSVERALRGLERPEAIYERNLQTLQELGPEGWRALDVGPGASTRGRP